MTTIDANEAVARVAYRTNEIIAIYPITPASPMGEWCDEWASRGRENLWGSVPDVTEMQSEAGAIGAVHGALQAGSLATTFTASQGLLLMVPNMYKIAGELTCLCMHVAARTVATHALSIFGDHSDVMACRQTGFAMLASNSVQEAHDFACIGQAATLRTRIPFLHFFDGFRTSHEMASISVLDDATLSRMIPDDLIGAHRARALSPDHPVLRGTAANPDTFFQAREASNPYYASAPGIVQEVMDQFGTLTGRSYRLFDYFGHPRADRIIVMMGSGTETARETVEYLSAKGEKVGVVAARLFRPFSIEGFLRALPATAQRVAVLDRTKEPGSVGEPLYQDIVVALEEARRDGRLPPTQTIPVIGGRYGLSSKEFTPAMAKAVFDELGKPRPGAHFTVGIVDDVSHGSLDYDREWEIEPDDVTRAVFFGLGWDGTVGANKNSIRIIGEETGARCQAYFVYDSKKSGSMTVSHLRFGSRPIRSEYLIRSANVVACHHHPFLEKLDVVGHLRPGGIFLLNAPYGPDAVFNRLPREVQAALIDKHARFYVIDASKLAEETGMGGRINTIMQVCFFSVSGLIAADRAVQRMRAAIRDTYGKKGREVVEMNLAAVDRALDHLHEVQVPDRVTTDRRRPPVVAGEAPDFVKRVTAVMMAGKGDLLPVSAFPVDGTWPTGTARWEKRALAHSVPQWEPAICIQCNKCALVCPHAAIRAKIYEPGALEAAPPSFQSCGYRSHDLPDLRYTIQVAPEDCTGCDLCVVVCPAKDKATPRRKAINMTTLGPVLETEKRNYAFFLGLTDPPVQARERVDVKTSQFLTPLFEYSGACAGCGETPYIKLLTQLYGDRLIIANATGCSSIYGGNLPTTPYAVDAAGRGPAWSNSLFEDNAEFGFGMRLAVDSLRSQASDLVRRLAPEIGETLADEILAADLLTHSGIEAQRRRLNALRQRLQTMDTSDARRLDVLAEHLVPRSLWLVGGDGWAYDIGFGGLDHVLSMKRDINVLILDTEVYSNTGGQASKSTPLAAAAKFASAGKEVHKKDLGLEAMTYGHVYVASVAFGAKDAHTVQVFQEAAEYDGPSVVIAYSPCIAHGYDLKFGAHQQKLAVGSGAWPLYRFDPRRIAAGEHPLSIDADPGRNTIEEYMRNELRFRMVEARDRERFRKLAGMARRQAALRIALYEQLSHITLPNQPEPSTQEEVR